MTNQEQTHRDFKKSLNLPITPAEQQSKSFSPIRYSKQWKEYLLKLKRIK